VATLEELFKGDFKYGALGAEVIFSLDNVIACKAIGRLYLAFDEYACFLAYYVSEEYATPEKLEILIAQYRESLNILYGTVEMSMSHPVHDPVGASSHDLPFTGRIIFYVETTLDDSTKQRLIDLGNSHGLHIQVRDRRYEELVNTTEKPLAFISHDSRDKDFVEKVAAQLRSVLCPVWYDDYSLKPGASLRESIDAGLRDSKRCVVVLSPNFLSNPGWTKGEFNAAVTKHFNSGGNVLIPIWHDVTRQEVADYSPLVVDIVAINSNIGVEEVFRRLHRVLVADEAT
jgi:hypothetical protein